MNDIFTRVASALMHENKNQSSFEEAFFDPALAKRKLAQKEADLEAMQQTMRRNRAILARLTEAAAWLNQGMILSCSDGSMLHDLWRAIRNGKVASLIDDSIVFTDAVAVAHSFIIQHDWHAALSRSDEFASGEYVLPYSICAFEMTINNSRVICLCAEGEPKTFRLFALLNRLWSELPECESVNDQIRAVCIALEAQVAGQNVVRREHNGQVIGGKKESHYSVVNLANRTVRNSVSLYSETGKKRLHFVRGHWRHYQQHKTWIKWHVRGDPDLGFIDKEYRV